MESFQILNLPSSPAASTYRPLASNWALSTQSSPVCPFCMVRRSVPLPTSQTLAVRSLPAVRRRFPLGSNATESSAFRSGETCGGGEPIAARTGSAATDQNLNVPSSLPVRTVAPFDANDALSTFPVCPRSWASIFPFLTFQIPAVSSWLAVTSNDPSGLKATCVTAPS